MPRCAAALHLHAQLGVEVALLHVAFLPRRLVEDVAAVLGGIRRLCKPCQSHVALFSTLGQAYRVKMQADSHLPLIRILYPMQP